MSIEHQGDGVPESSASGRVPLAASTRIAVAVLCLVGSVVLFLVLRERVTIETLVQYESRLVAVARANPVSVVPLATVLTLVISWLFQIVFGPGPGFVLAVVVVSCGSTAGATVCFWLSRYLLRQVIAQRFGARLEMFQIALRREGDYFLFLLRLTPIVPCYDVNLVMGLTDLRARTFWWVSQVGMLPGTLVYVYAGWSVPCVQVLAESGGRDVLNVQRMVALTLLGTFPWLARRLAVWLKRRLAAG